MRKKGEVKDKFNADKKRGSRNSAKGDLRKLMRSNLRSGFEKVVSTLKEEPYADTQSFEILHPKQEGRYSRRINRQHRVVYKVNDDTLTVEIYSAWSHYE